jgi:hypothetical protein
MSSLIPDGRDPAERSHSDGALLGSWSATRWQYTSRSRPERMVDVVCDLRGTVTLSLSAGTYILAWDIAGLGSQSLGGTYAVRDHELEFAVSSAEVRETVAFRLGAEELSLRGAESAWDFDGAGHEEPADFVAVFVRL